MLNLATFISAVILTSNAQDIFFPDEVVDVANNPEPSSLFDSAQEDSSLLPQVEDVLTKNFGSGFSSGFNSVSGCTTPSGRRGVCVDVRQCPPLFRIASNLNRKNYRTLSRHVCSRTRSRIFFCCSSSISPRQNPTTTTTTTTRRPFFTQPVRPSRGLPTDCGKVPLVNRITRGVPTVPGELPFLVALGNPSGSTFTSICTGVLITNQHVLSAAHCYNNQNPTHVRVGEHNTKSPSDDHNMEERFIVEKKFSNYQRSTNENDIVLLRMDRPVFFTDYIQPVCLPVNRPSNEQFVDRYMVIAGWGTTREGSSLQSPVLRKAFVQGVDLQSCQAKYRRTKSRPTIDFRQLCAGSDSGADTCQGDSGGPLMITEVDANGGKYIAVGLTSFGVGCGRPDYAGVYTRISSFLPWIMRSIQ